MSLGLGPRGFEIGVLVSGFWVFGFSRFVFGFLGLAIWIARIWFSGFGFSIFVFS